MKSRGKSVDEPRIKPTYLGAPAIFKLDLACMNLHQAFCVGEKFGGIFLVGSALERPSFRDVDVVCMVDDDGFARLFPDAHHPQGTIAFYENDPRWLVMSSAISDWLSKQIDHPVDFKFQPMTLANECHKGKRRHPLGHRTVALRLASRANEK